MTNPTEPSGLNPDERDEQDFAPTQLGISAGDSEEPTPQPTDNETQPAQQKAVKPDNPQGQQPDSQPRSRQQTKPRSPSVVARYGLMRYIGEFSHNLTPPPMTDGKIVVRTERGVELAKVIAMVNYDPDKPHSPRSLSGENLNRFLKNSGPDFPFHRTGRVLRKANQQDEVDFRHLEASAKDEGKYCRQKIKEQKLSMRLVAAEHMLGGERIVFFFTAESRVDFRELVRDLASQFRTRIEMRQVGARDEARLIGDYERCGQRCCCQGFLKYLKPVSMRMAKVQKATLDPSKISGRCSRLMCCLRYEDESYSELRKSLPRRNTWLRTKDYLGKVIDAQIITQMVRLQLPDKTFVVVGVDELIEREMQPPTEEQCKIATARHAAIRREATASPPPPQFTFSQTEDDDEQASQGEVLSEDAPKEAQPGEKKSRRSRRRKKPLSQQTGHQQPAAEAPPKGSSESSQTHPQKKRRRRRRKKK